MLLLVAVRRSFEKKPAVLNVRFIREINFKVMRQK